MAAGQIASPGTEYGPCVEMCEHTDCQANRKIAESNCRVCGKKIGYETRFFQEENWTVFVHLVCFVKEVEAKKEKKTGCDHELDEHEGVSYCTKCGRDASDFWKEGLPGVKSLSQTTTRKGGVKGCPCCKVSTVPEEGGKA